MLGFWIGGLLIGLGIGGLIGISVGRSQMLNDLYKNNKIDEPTYKSKL